MFGRVHRNAAPGAKSAIYIRMPLLLILNLQLNFFAYDNKNFTIEAFAFPLISKLFYVDIK